MKRLWPDDWYGRLLTLCLGAYLGGVVVLFRHGFTGSIGYAALFECIILAFVTSCLAAVRVLNGVDARRAARPRLVALGYVLKGLWSPIMFGSFWVLHAGYVNVGLAMLLVAMVLLMAGFLLSDVVPIWESSSLPRRDRWAS